MFRFGHVHFQTEDDATKFYYQMKSQIFYPFSNTELKFMKSYQYKNKEKVIDKPVSFFIFFIIIISFLIFFI